MLRKRYATGDDVKEHGNRDSNGRWLKGQTGNAAGRGMTNRQRISEKLLADIAKVWETHGQTVLERLAATEPATLAKIAYGLLPRDLMISVEARTPGNLAFFLPKIILRRAAHTHRGAV
jgi:hypothetical protein